MSGNGHPPFRVALGTSGSARGCRMSQRCAAFIERSLLPEGRRHARSMPETGESKWTVPLPLAVCYAALLLAVPFVLPFVPSPSWSRLACASGAYAWVLLWFKRPGPPSQAFCSMSLALVVLCQVVTLRGLSASQEIARDFGRTISPGRPLLFAVLFAALVLAFRLVLRTTRNRVWYPVVCAIVSLSAYRHLVVVAWPIFFDPLAEPLSWSEPVDRRSPAPRALSRPFGALEPVDGNPGRRSQTRSALGWLLCGPLALGA